MCCNVPVGTLVFKHTDNACAPSMMDDRTANFEKCCPFNFKPFSSETQNTVLHLAFELNSAAAAAAAETGI